MEIKKIEELVKHIGSETYNKGFSDKEFLLLVANLLIGFGTSTLKNDPKYSGLDFGNAYEIELAISQDPNNLYLSSLLQGHILISWSKSAGE